MNEEIQIPENGNITNLENLLDICHQKLQNKVVKQVVWTCKMREMAEKVSKPFVIQ